MRIELLELATLSVGSPAQLAIPSVPQIGRRDLLETARRVEASGKLVGNRLVVYEAVFVRGADGLLVQLLSVQDAAFDPGDLGANEGSSVFERLGVALRPHFQLSVMVQHRIEVARSPFRVA